MGDAPPGGANVQLEQGYFRLANKLATAIALAPWDAAPQLRMVMALMRATYGIRGRKTAELGSADWRVLTGMDDRKIRRTKKQLEDEGVLILVRDFDAREQRPQEWQLQKDFTRWGKYSVATDDLKDAEDHVLKLGTPTGGGVTSDRRGEGSQTPSEQGSPVTGDQGSHMSPGTDSEAAPALDERPPKERKERKDSLLLPTAAAKPDADPDAVASAVIRVANRGMADNPEIGSAMSPIPASHGSRTEVLEWLQEGISQEAIEAAVYETAKTYQPDPPRRRQISTMKYFTGPVHDEWARLQAQNTEAPNGTSNGKRGRSRGAKGPPQRFDYSDATEEFTGFDESDPEAVPGGDPR